MHGRGGDYRKQSLHMCTLSVAGGLKTSNSSSLLKDGRKIRVGDCAFFKPPQDSPPFIGIIRCLITSKESTLKFTVNWLYRASEVEIEKGIHLEAAPNEIFYSFHKDEVPAASLLHPCKVAFLPKGVELPPGISSFICRRVYDTDQKCLWWLTDQNYIDKRQKEVDHLISKTSEEMHATVLSGGRSPKRMNDVAPALQVKADSYTAQAVSSITSHGKGKKRERSDADSEAVKQLHMAAEGESYQPMLENNLNSEITRITERGRLVDYESVQKLVQLMMPDKADKKINFTGRSMFAGVVAATDKFDCLSWFVKLKGLSVFDDWLQDIHKGKTGEGNGHKDGDKSAEEFLLVLLRALDKLPVNLRALQMCNIGKSVNHLRSHKNLEIQRKARSLVDIWKKRVEAEMNIDDGKHGSNVGVSWHGRHTSETSQGDGQGNGGSSENAVKSSSSQLSAPRTVSPKHTQCDTRTVASPKYTTSALSPAAGVVVSNDAQPKTAAVGEADHLTTSAKDEISSSSSQSLSQSSSSDHMKTAQSSGEDPRSSTAGSVGAGEMLRRTSRPRRAISSLQEHMVHGAARDGGSNRSPLHKHIGSEKLSQCVSINEKIHDVSVADGNTHKLIVKIPNRARSPAVSANGGTINERCLSNSQAKSPPCPDKHEKMDEGNASQLNGTSDVMSKSWHSSDLKDVLTGFDETEGTSAANLNEVRSTNGDQTRRINELPKVASPVAHETKPRKTNELSSFSPMNALVESCVKHCEASALISAVDDVGINLLASVAASEMSKCNSIATYSPGNTGVTKDSVAGNFGRSLQVDELTHCTAMVKHDNEKQDESTLLVKNGRDVISSTNEKLATDVSNPGLRKNQDDAQLFDMRPVSFNEISMKLLPDSKVGNLKEASVSESEVFPTKVKHSECTRKEVPRTPVHSPRGSNSGFENKAREVVGSGLHVKKESPSTTHSDSHGANDKMHTPLSLVRHVDSEKAVMEAERLADRKNGFVSNLSGCMVRNQNKTESRDNKLWTTEIYSKVSDLGSVATDYTRNYKDINSQNKEVSGHFNGGSDLSKASNTKMSECLSTDALHATPAVKMEKLKFDLNEGFTADEVPKSISGVSYSAAVHIANPLPFSAVSNGLPASVTVASAAKGAFVPPEDLLRTRGELGWKGSAATSAFRPAEPRKNSELQVNISAPSGDPGKSSRPFLNIDLNAPNESMQDEMASRSGTGDIARNHSSTPARGFGGFDLDLNQIDEAAEVGQFSSLSNRKLEVPVLPFKPGNLFIDESSGRKNFDLNNGPVLEELGAEASTLGQNTWSGLPSRPPVVDLRMNNGDMGSFSSWFPHGSVIPAVLPDKGGDQAFSIATTGTSQRIYYTPPGSASFAPDVYRGPVLSSSPGLSFPSAPYQYPLFPFGASFQVPTATLSSSATFMDSLPGGMHNHPTGHSQYLGHPGVVSSSYPRPYMISIPDGRSNGGQENTNRWGSRGLDLNSGPRSIEVEGRNDALPFALRQFSAPSSQTFTEEQVRMFQASGVVLKRKEPDGGWDAEKPKQQSWH